MCRTTPSYRCGGLKATQATARIGEAPALSDSGSELSDLALERGDFLLEFANLARFVVLPFSACQALPEPLQLLMDHFDAFLRPAVH